ncbi:hypothetical protein BDW22DRAFT_1357531 [Trametopsis cervina]|nr:hypothetical protein BDW22DRAFT_1357531 [Trametopsis cervina]
MSMLFVLRKISGTLSASCARKRPLLRYQSSQANQPKPNENLKVSHARFLAEGTRSTQWSEAKDGSGKDAVNSPEADYDSLTDGKGKLSPTSSHLLKLILPLDRLKWREDHPGPPTVFLLHPSQPLSHIGRLVASSLTPDRAMDIKFRSTSPKGLTLDWSDSTDLGDFIRDAARAREFEMYVFREDGQEKTLQIEVPTFADRTRFLRRRLDSIQTELQSMEVLKTQCDQEAHRGARKMATSGLGMLVMYWGAVARLTFWDLGWDIMEPVTYLSGLSMVILGYLWFLYQGREVSYSSVLHRSISTRRQALYKSHGFDIERWADLIAEEKAVRKEISKIAEDYDERRWKEHDDEREADEAKASKEVKEIKSHPDSDDAFRQETDPSPRN